MIESKWIKIIDQAKSRPLHRDEIIELTNALANSGRTESFANFDTYDVASTGGPSSLSTLICPLYLSASGVCVPKLGVPGRPAGGIDVLEQIPGFSAQIGPTNLTTVLRSAGYAHFLSNGVYAPLDAKTFKYRKIIGAQAIPELVIASLLAKKIAVDVKNIGLDVRISRHGNIGATYDDAAAFAREFIEIARTFGRRAQCFLTDASFPFQPYIGRGEALLALQKIFEGQDNSWLQEHLQLCRKMTSSLLASRDIVSVDRLRKSFKRNIEAQGSNYSEFRSAVKSIESQNRIVLHANGDGFVMYDLASIRNFITNCQNRSDSKNAFPDPVGVELLAHPAKSICKGQPVMSVRCSHSNIVSESSDNWPVFYSIVQIAQSQKEMVIIDE